jgi:roadblock/LC7 domain-containing protein
MNVVQQALQGLNVSRAEQLLRSYLPKRGQEEVRDWEWRYFWPQAQNKSLRVLRGHTLVPRYVGYTPDGKTLITGALDNTVRLWDAATGRELAKLDGPPRGGPPAGIGSAALSPNGKMLAGGALDIRLWEIPSGRVIATLPDQKVFHGNTYRLAFSPDNRLLAVASSGDQGGDDEESAKDDAIHLWDVTMRPPRLVRTLPAKAGRLTFFPDGKTLASTDLPGGGMQLWDVASGKMLPPPTSPLLSGAFRLVFSSDGKWMAARNTDDTKIRIWDVAAGRVRATVENPSGLAAPSAFSPDGRLLLGYSDQSIHVWEVATGKEQATLMGHTGSIRAAIFSPDGKQIASGSMDGTARLWTVPSVPKATCFGAMPTMGWACGRWPSRRTVACWPRPVWTVRSGYGTPFPKARSAACGSHRRGSLRGLLAGRQTARLGQCGRDCPPVGRSQATGDTSSGCRSHSRRRVRRHVLAGRKAPGPHQP